MDYIIDYDPIEEYYKEPRYFSYSALKLLLWSPAAYKSRYIDRKEKERTEKHLIDGKVIHCLILNKHIFEDLFVVSPMTIPSGNNKLVVDKVFKIYNSHEINTDYKLSDFDGDILRILSEVDLHQSLIDDRKADKEGVQKTGDQKRLDKILTEENINYFNYLKAKGTREVIDQETYDRCELIANKLKLDPVIIGYMGLSDIAEEGVEVFNEEELKFWLDKRNFGIKGIIDNRVVDHNNKIIRINDVKTTSKTLAEFSESVEFYKYWLQATIYVGLVYNNNPNLKDYRMEFRFIVIDSLDNIYSFLVTDSTLISWLSRTEEILNIASYHYNKSSFGLPMEFDMGVVKL